MHLYNYVAGDAFPPSMPEHFDISRFGGVDVVYFVLEDQYERSRAFDLAHRLQAGRDYRGLVYSYSPSNRDYLSCLRFFEVEPTSYVVLDWETFQRHLCADRDGTNRSPDEGGVLEMPQRRRRIRAGKSGAVGGMTYGVIETRGSEDTDCEALLAAGRAFVTRGIPDAFGDWRSCVASMDKIHAAWARRQSSARGVEVSVLFARSPEHHTEFERGVFRAFLEYGKGTDDISVRVMYPTHVSQDYEAARREFGIVRLPAAVFHAARSGRAALTLERDAMECVLDAELPFIVWISDVHRLFESKPNMMPADALPVLREMPMLCEWAKGGKVGKVIRVHAQNAVIVEHLRGDVVLGDKRIESSEGPKTAMSRLGKSALDWLRRSGRKN